MNQNISEDSVAALRFCLEQIINDQKGCIERQEFIILDLKKKVDIFYLILVLDCWNTFLNLWMDQHLKILNLK